VGSLDPELQPRGPRIPWTAAQTNGQWLRGLTLAGKWRLEQRGFSEGSWGPRTTSLAGWALQACREEEPLFQYGGFWRGEEAWKLSGPQGQPFRSGDGVQESGGRTGWILSRAQGHLPRLGAISVCSGTARAGVMGPSRQRSQPAPHCVLSSHKGTGWDVRPIQATQGDVTSRSLVLSAKVTSKATLIGSRWTQFHVGASFNPPQ